jgi:hypothetical protein
VCKALSVSSILYDLNRLYLPCFKEILFKEEGEPKIDGEPGYLKVVIYPRFFYAHYSIE